MIATIIITIALFVNSDQGYTIVGDHIVFSYASDNPNLDIHVSGNFNNWSKDSAWKMKFAPGSGYVLSVPVSEVQTTGRSFYEFTFRINGTLTDANAKASNVVHCAGYGTRYVIHF